MSTYISLRNTNTEQKVCTDKKCYYRVKRLAYSLFYIYNGTYGSKWSQICLLATSNQNRRYGS